MPAIAIQLSYYANHLAMLFAEMSFILGQSFSKQCINFFLRANITPARETLHEIDTKRVRGLLNRRWITFSLFKFHLCHAIKKINSTTVVSKGVTRDAL